MVRRVVIVIVVIIQALAVLGVDVDKTKNSALIQFADYQLQLGEGKLPHLINSKYKNDIQLPRNISAEIEEIELFHKVFYDIENNYKIIN